MQFISFEPQCGELNINTVTNPVTDDIETLRCVDNADDKTLRCADVADDNEMTELKRRLLETEAQMSRILQAMEAVQQKVGSAVTESTLRSDVVC